MEGDYKEVRFDIYCEQCEYRGNAQDCVPCDECLSNPGNIDSRKPVNFKQRETNDTMLTYNYGPIQEDENV